MSYILDALRRADAERQRGAVPGLHAQAPIGMQSGATAAPAGPARRLGLAASVLLLLGLAVAAGWLLRPGAAPALAAAGQPGTGLAVGPAAAIPAALAPPVLAVPAPAARLLPAPPAGMPMPMPMPIPVLSQPAAPTRRPALVASAPAAPVAETSAAPAPARPASVAAPARLPSLAELPLAQQRELGPLLVGGAMHAEQAALRIVILNGQVFHEGDLLSAELQVQQIRLKSVVMSHRGQRFELPF